MANATPVNSTPEVEEVKAKPRKDVRRPNPPAEVEEQGKAKRVTTLPNGTVIEDF